MNVATQSTKIVIALVMTFVGSQVRAQSARSTDAEIAALKKQLKATEQQKQQTEEQRRLAEQQKALAEQSQQQALKQQSIIAQQEKIAQQQRIQAEKEKQISDKEAINFHMQALHAGEEKQHTLRLLYAVHMSQAQQAWEDGNVKRMQKLLSNYQSAGENADVRGFEWYYLRRLSRNASAKP